MREAIASRMGVTAQQVTLALNIAVASEVYDAVVDSEAWPACLEIAQGAVTVRLQPPTSAAPVNWIPANSPADPVAPPPSLNRATAYGTSPGRPAPSPHSHTAHQAADP
jgi:hypothetical protein